jgi:phage shock protein E
MKSFLKIALLALFAISAQARDVTYNGTKPQAIIDVRTPAEFAAGHVDGAINIPLEVVGQQISTISGLRKDSAIVLYCRSGKRSEVARATLEQQGYKNVVNAGSLETLEKNLKPCPAQGC